MKHTLTLFGTTALTVTLFTSLAFSQKSDEKETPEKTRHIKVMKMIDGKKMELDTVITGNNLLVWQGDTLNPVKHIGEFSPSGFDKIHHFDMEVDQNGHRKNVMIYQQDGGKGSKEITYRIESGDENQGLNEADGDSSDEKIIIRKRMRDDGGNPPFHFGGPNMKHFPPRPPLPPIPHFKMLPQGRVIDLNDPNIISYKKKNLHGGREKIEIIRKKAGKNENMSFEFNDGNEVVAPEMPEMPDMEGDIQHIKMIEKKTKVDGNDRKQVDVKVETEQNK